MSAKKLALSWLVVFTCVTVLNILIHGILLSADYQSLPQLMRPPIDGPKYMPYMLFAFAVYALAMVWIYAQGAAGNSVARARHSFRSRGVGADFCPDVPDLLLSTAVALGNHVEADWV